MCQTRSIRYTCGHRISFRLSACLGTNTYPLDEVPQISDNNNGKHRHRREQPRTSSDVICHGTPTLCLASEVKCGPCSGLDSLVDRKVKVLPRPRPCGRRRISWDWESDAKGGGEARKDDSNRVDEGSSWKREPSLLSQALQPEDVVLTYEEDAFAFIEGQQLKSMDEEWDRVWNALPGDEEVEEEGYGDTGSESGSWGEGDHDDDEPSFESSDRETWPTWTRETEEQKLVEQERSVVENDAFGRLSLYPSGWNCATDGGKICCF